MIHNQSIPSGNMPISISAASAAIDQVRKMAKTNDKVRGLDVMSYLNPAKEHSANPNTRSYFDIAVDWIDKATKSSTLISHSGTMDVLNAAEFCTEKCQEVIGNSERENCLKMQMGVFAFLRQRDEQDQRDVNAGRDYDYWG